MKAWLATARAGWRMKRNVARRRQERPKRSVVPTAEATQKENPSVIQDGTLERLELSPQELRPGFPHLPSVWKPSWVDPEVRPDVLQAVLPQQRQGDWLHQDQKRSKKHHEGFWILGFAFCARNSCSVLSQCLQLQKWLLISGLFNAHAGGPKTIVTYRKLKENGYTPRTQKKGSAGNVHLDDYRPIDPSPSSKASIKHGPIEHGAPIIPYIPKPSPPARPNPGGTP
ncbi:unnamed protein product [Malus baccata var. baccata]